MPITGHVSTALIAAIVMAALCGAIASEFVECCDHDCTPADPACGCASCDVCAKWGLWSPAPSGSQLRTAARIWPQSPCSPSVLLGDPLFHPPEVAASIS